MDGTGARQLPLSSIDLQVTNKGDWAPNRKRRSRKPQETFRHQNTDSDDIMSDLIEYGQVDNLAAIEPVASRSEVPTMTLQQEFSAGAIDLYRSAVEMWHSEDSESVLENHSANSAANNGELSAIHQLGSLGSGGRFYLDELADDLNVSHGQSMEDDRVIAEDDFMDEDFSVYGNDEDQTGCLASSSSDPKQTSPKTVSSSLACEICGRSFKGRAQLASHMKSHRHPLHCNICSIRFTSQGTMLWHQRFVHAAQKYNHTCEVCGETLRLKQELISHYTTHRLAKGVVKCKGCGQSFRNTVTLKLHEINLCWRQGKNNNIENEAEKMMTGSTLSTDNEVVSHDENTALHESHCSSYSATEDRFVDSGGNCDTNDDGNPDESNSMDCGPLLSYSCPFCGQTFHSKGLYTIHTKKHTKPHSCDVCGRGFAKKFTMECHRKTHLTQKDYHCELCGQAFTLRPQLLKHRADNHEMANGVSCKYCDAKFKHRALLRRHLAYCCPKAPANKDGDRAKLGGLPESEQGYQCAQCDKNFDTQWALEQHAKYHKRKYSCEICGNKYGERFLLQSHLHTHLGVRPYKCTVCGASFTLKAHCDRHCRMHLRVQHFKCETCGYMFRYEHDRFTHMSKFCLGTKEDKPDLSKMMAVEKPDYAQLGVTSSMLGYTKQPPGKHPSSLSSPQPTEHDVPATALQEGAQADALTEDADKKESVEGGELVKKPPLKCHICGKKLKRKAILMVHLAREHGIGEEPFKCFICGLGAAFEKTMRVHLESHLPYKRYQCTNCGVRFSNKRTLGTHALHEKCLSSSFRRPSESINSESNANTEIVFVDEDLSLEPCSAEKDLGLNASCKAILKDSNVITEDESGVATEMRIKAEIVDSCYEKTNGSLCSSADDDDDNNDDEDNDNGCEDDGNDVEDDDETVCGELSPAEDCEQDNSAERVQDQFEDIGKDGGKQPVMTGQNPSDVDNGRLICVIKKERNGSGYRVQTQQDEESLKSSSNVAVSAVESDKLHDDDKRRQLLSVPLRVKVLRDGFGNERIFVNGELFHLWCDYALEATRTGDVNCHDIKEWCEICQWFIVGRYKYRVHMQRHSQDRPFACDVCSKAFKTTENLRTHMRWHDPSRLIVCTICGAKCLSPSDMKRHMTVHEGVKPYVCSTCGKGFRRKMYLNTHVRTHTGETPFSCDICGRRFRIYSSLHDHQKLHSGYKPFECSVCHKRFAQRANWRTHERRHKGVKNFECEVCQKGFVQNYELQNHRLRCVKQDLPYICLLCGMKFTKEHPLKRHINRHSCGICGKQFVIMKEKVSHQLQCRRQSKSDVQLL